MREDFLNEVRSKYPNITSHIDKFGDQGLITSDRVPYGIHRSRDRDCFEGNTRIVSVRKTPYPKFAPVDEPYYMDEGVVILRPENATEVMIAIFNSKILHFWYREGFGKTMGGLLQMDQEVITDAPVKLPTEDDKRDQLASMTTSIQKLRQQISSIRAEWETEAGELQSRERAFEQLLINDKTHRQQGSTELAWTKSVDFYPDADKEVLNREYSGFEIKGNPDDDTLTIYGIVDGELEEAYQLIFNNTDLLEHIYLSVRRTLRGGKQIKNLHDLLKKTVVPVILPDSASRTQNIAQNVQSTVSSQFDTAIETHNEIERREDELDAIVCDLYELDREQVELILESLDVRRVRKNRILNERGQE